MLRKLVRHIEKEDLFYRNEKLLVAVSGGLDSVVLLHLLHKMEMNCVVAHCNFRLRAGDSDGDEIFVGELAEKYSFPFCTTAFDTTAYAKEKAISIEMAARDLRYEWFESIRQANQCLYILTAHHADDVIETVLINLARGTGIHGLTGIKAKKDRLIRPLLPFSRDELKAYAEENTLNYREDYTNAQTDFVRNKIRHQIIPVLREINPSIQKTMNENVARFSDVELIYNNEISNKKMNFINQKDDKLLISVSELKNLPANKSHLFELLKPYGFHSRDVANIIESLDATSGKLFYSENYQLLRDREYLILIEKEEKVAGEYELNKSGLSIEEELKLECRIFELSSDFKFSTDPQVACFDADKLSFPLKLRKWQEGDVFHPIGMKGRKKISDYFIDNKFSLTDKEDAWLLVSGDDIIWLVGHRMDDRYKITKATRSIYQVSNVLR
ncbi:tRNA lysidine(34) synthetase TilS [Ancylomarina euxinus]|uniref:tRNA(Ile)-lysidine synthase n=1 Tax=Ancylomarina euxinus TaxID=2283627 RepID=A0A425Y0A3_9BACT|nr:tRNA lysidine(34) synthetase TilS [Ancylomarina euxinus]MCZ4695262.1 tRNA lysidine(34) synthetase TilS [Ancylomarina euxinus]MUP15459.1 tRNA lysidine(34) synthetase TilS [Ancylomarina euxinus]RRG21169.1 tRNA lysidine(34) synthetase TilS [Ancylomarina euxinus]